MMRMDEVSELPQRMAKAQPVALTIEANVPIWYGEGEPPTMRQGDDP